MLTTPKLLLLSEDKNEVYYLRETLGGYATLAHAQDLTEMSSLLDGAHYDVLLCGWPFYRDEWHGAMKHVRERYPDLPVIVLSAAEATQHWMEVLNAGAFDVLALPSPKLVMLPVMEHARVSHDARRLQRTAAVESAELLAS